MTHSTPITDKLKKYLTIIEKLTLANPLDTGFDTSNFNKNWIQAGKDVDHFLGIDDFNKKYGGDSNVINTVTYSKAKTLDRVGRDLSNSLFTGVRKEKLTLLRVRKASVQEAVHNYIWKMNLLLETTSANPIQVSNELSNFWRVDKTSNDVYVNNVKFPTSFFYAVDKPVVIGSLLHSANGTLPSPAISGASKLQSYAINNCSTYITEAINKIKPFVQDEESLILLNQLSTLQLHQLPMIIYDSIILGISDAANTGILKESKATMQPSGVTRFGTQVLNPVVAAPILEMLASKMNSPNQEILPDEVMNSLVSTLELVKNTPIPYDSHFLLDLKEAMRIRKFDIQKSTQTALTTLYSTIALIINQINKSFAGTVIKNAEPKFYFGRFGYDKDRSKEQEQYLGDSLVDTTAPIVVLRGTAPEGTNITDLVYYLESYVITLDLKSKTRSFEQLPPKPLGIPSNIHNFIAHKARREESVNGQTVSIVDKEDYIREFLAIQDKSAASSIPNAQFGRFYWEQILRVAYSGNNKFNSGVFFVGLPPVLWDTSENNSPILIPADGQDLVNKLFLNYIELDNNGREVESTQEYAISSAIGLYYDIVLYPGMDQGVGRIKPIDISTETGRHRVEERFKKVFSLYKFQTLAEVREELLQDLYSEEKSSQQFLASKCKHIIYKLFKNVEGGFWSLDGGKTLASYNPWEYGENNETIKFRFRKENTTSHVQTIGRNVAAQKYSNIIAQPKNQI